mgnify:FL=1|tara:strand:- start:397 stop:753 length:357 start_codon:yes stop_codon:yes gene_type:complete
MKRLKLEDISNPPALKEQEVELEMWNKSVIVTGLTKADTVEINELSENEDGVRDDVLFEKYLLMKGMKDPGLESLEDVEKFYSNATPQIIDQILLGVYKCMAWTKEDQASVAEQFPEQ